MHNNITCWSSIMPKGHRGKVFQTTQIQPVNGSEYSLSPDGILYDITDVNPKRMRLNGRFSIWSYIGDEWIGYILVFRNGEIEGAEQIK